MGHAPSRRARSECGTVQAAGVTPLPLLCMHEPEAGHKRSKM